MTNADPPIATAETVHAPADEAALDVTALAPIPVPRTLDQLAARKAEAAPIIAARVNVLTSVRMWALRACWPQDFVLFKSDDGLVIAYLEDAGCDRVRPYYGIEIFDVGDPIKTVSPTDPSAYYYTVKASGLCKLTGETLEAVEGGRSSAEEFVKHVADPLQKDLYVRRAARASADGIVVRTLAGLQSVPEEELAAAWTGSGKSVTQCRKGRGFGSKTERLGGVRESDPNVRPPVCPHCKATGKYRPARGDRDAFYGCPNYANHPQQKWIVDAAEWIRQQTPAQPAPGQIVPPGTNSPAAREPGAEG
jgi:hypothetical protein